MPALVLLSSALAALIAPDAARLIEANQRKHQHIREEDLDEDLPKAYIPSTLELEWLEHADSADWVANICDRDRSSIKLWYDEVQDNRPAKTKVDKHVFSIMPGSTMHSKDYIEPLAYFLRSPMYPCLDEPMIKTFLRDKVDPDLVEHLTKLNQTTLHEFVTRFFPRDSPKEVSRLRGLVSGKTAQDVDSRLADVIRQAANDKRHIILSAHRVPYSKAYLFDLGGKKTTPHSFYDFKSSNWLVETYANLGIYFNEIFSWGGDLQIDVLNLTSYANQVVQPSVHFLPEPTMDDVSSKDENNPIEKLKRKCQPDDFCVIKIDTPEQMDDKILRGILDDGIAQARIDELFFDAADWSRTIWKHATSEMTDHKEDTQQKNLIKRPLWFQNLSPKLQRRKEEVLERVRKAKLRMNGVPTQPEETQLNFTALAVQDTGWMQPLAKTYRILRRLRGWGIRAHGI